MSATLRPSRGGATRQHDARPSNTGGVAAASAAACACSIRVSVQNGAASSSAPGPRTGISARTAIRTKDMSAGVERSERRTATSWTWNRDHDDTPGTTRVVCLGINLPITNSNTCQLSIAFVEHAAHGDARDVERRSKWADALLGVWQSPSAVQELFTRARVRSATLTAKRAPRVTLRDLRGYQLLWMSRDWLSRISLRVRLLHVYTRWTTQNQWATQVKGPRLNELEVIETPGCRPLLHWTWGRRATDPAGRTDATKWRPDSEALSGNVPVRLRIADQSQLAISSQLGSLARAQPRALHDVAHAVHSGERDQTSDRCGAARLLTKRFRRVRAPRLASRYGTPPPNNGLTSRLASPHSGFQSAADETNLAVRQHRDG